MIVPGERTAITLKFAPGPVLHLALSVMYKVGFVVGVGMGEGRGVGVLAFAVCVAASKVNATSVEAAASTLNGSAVLPSAPQAEAAKVNTPDRIETAMREFIRLFRILLYLSDDAP
jgi:hypothetical protein